MKIGYIRVSDRDQNPGRQIEKMKALGIEERFLFVDKQTGKTFDRPQYQALKRIIREGDLIYIDALDRLGRDYDGIIAEWKEITRTLGADIVVLDHEALFDSRKFKTMGDIGKLMEDQFLSLLSYVADQEREKIRKRQREGIDLALAEKRPYGRPRAKITAKLEPVRKAMRDPRPRGTGRKPPWERRFASSALLIVPHGARVKASPDSFHSSPWRSCDPTRATGEAATHRHERK